MFWMTCLKTPIPLLLSLILTLTLGSTSSLTAQINSLNIVGPEQVRPGQLVRLKAEIEKGESPFWIVLSPGDLDYEQVDNGRRLIFSVPCQMRKEIVVMLLSQQMSDGRISTRQLRRQISVVPADTPIVLDPGSDVDPVPIPRPDPITASPLYNATLKAISAIVDPQARAKLLEVADNFSAIARRCQQNEFDEPRTIWLTLAQQNRATVGPHLELWAPFAEAVQSEFKKLSLENVSSHAEPLSIVAAAIKKGVGQ